MKNGILLLLTTAVFAIGCQTARAATKPPEPNMAKCIASARVWDVSFKHELASFMGVPLDRVPALFCQRVFEAVRTGRLTFSDVNAIQLDQPTEIWRVIKGKPKAAPVIKAQPPRSSNHRNCTGIDGTFQVPISQKCPLSGYAHY